MLMADTLSKTPRCMSGLKACGVAGGRVVLMLMARLSLTLIGKSKTVTIG